MGNECGPGKKIYVKILEWVISYLILIFLICHLIKRGGVIPAVAIGVFLICISSGMIYNLLHRDRLTFFDHIDQMSAARFSEEIVIPAFIKAGYNCEMVSADGAYAKVRLRKDAEEGMAVCIVKRDYVTDSDLKKYMPEGKEDYICTNSYYHGTGSRIVAIDRGNVWRIHKKGGLIFT